MFEEGKKLGEPDGTDELGISELGNELGIKDGKFELGIFEGTALDGRELDG